MKQFAMTKTKAGDIDRTKKQMGDAAWSETIKP
jgi:hypothetical protein